MKRVFIDLISNTGAPLDSLELEDYYLGQPDGGDASSAAGDLTEEVERFLMAVAAKLSERAARPVGGVTRLRLAVGETLLSADDPEGSDDSAEEVRIAIAVEPEEQADGDSPRS